MRSSTHPAAHALEAGSHALCTCGASGNSPFCDGAHTRQAAAPAPVVRRPWWKVWG